MKKTILSVLAVCLGIPSLTQISHHDSLRNSFDYFERFLFSNITDSTPNAKEYARFNAYWKDRAWVDSNNGVPGDYAISKSIYNSVLPSIQCVQELGNDWELIGPTSFGQDQSIIGRITAIQQDYNNPDVLLAGSDQGSGIWRSDDFGQSWRSMTDDLLFPGLGIQDIQQDPNNHQLFIATTSNTGMLDRNSLGPYSSGILYSTDGGYGWHQLIDFNSPNLMNVAEVGAFEEIKFSPNDPNLAYAISFHHLWKIHLDQIGTANAIEAIEIAYSEDPRLSEKVEFHEVEVLDNNGEDRIFITSKTPTYREEIKVFPLYSDNYGLTWSTLEFEHVFDSLNQGYFESFESAADLDDPEDGGPYVGGAADWVREMVGGNWVYSKPSASITNCPISIYPNEFLFPRIAKPIVSFSFRIPAGSNLKLISTPHGLNSSVVIWDAAESYGESNDYFEETVIGNIEIEVTNQMLLDWQQNGGWFDDYSLILKPEVFDQSNVKMYVDDLSVSNIEDLIRPDIQVVSEFENELYIYTKIDVLGAGYLEKFNLLNESTHIFTMESENPAQSGHYWKCQLHVNNSGVFLGGLKLFQVEWSDIQSIPEFFDAGVYPSPDLHVDIRDIEDAVGIPDFVVLVGTDGGVNAVGTGTETFSFLNGNNLPITQFFGMDKSTSATNIIGGCIDNHSFIFDNIQWNQIYNGDGGRSMFFGADNELHAAWSNNTVIVGSNDGLLEEGDSPQQKFVIDQCLELDPQNPYVLWSAYKNLHYRDCSVYEVTYDVNDPDFVADPGFEDIDVPGEFETYNYLWESPYRNDLNAIAFSPDGNYIYLAESHPIRAASELENDHVKNVFFKYDRTTQEWIDLSDPLTNGIENDNLLRRAYTHFGIRTIVVDETNGDHMWVCFNGLNSGEVKYRVLESMDGGYSWTDISQGLPPFPVLDMVHQRNSGDRLYVGTDVGPYVYENGQWYCFGKNMPVCTVNDVDIDYCSGKIFCSTYGRGIWQNDLLPPSEPVAVTQDLIINSPTTYDNDILVAPGVTLTINSTLIMPGNGRIYVEEGAKLIVDGGTINGGGCEEKWKGIELFGFEYDLNQDETTQGKLVMLNGAKIENAKIGVTTYTDYMGLEVQERFGGGIIDATDSEFINCDLSVEMRKFPLNGTYAQTPNNKCAFRNVRFAWEESYFENATFAQRHIELSEVKNVLFEGCRFENETNIWDVHEKARGIGIRSNSASFIVTYLDDNDNGEAELTEYSRFDGLYRGVYADTWQIEYPCVIAYSDFTNTYGGVRLEALSNPTIVRNNFSVFAGSAPESPQSLYPYGLYMFECSGYEVEENTFLGSSNQYNAGIFVRNNSNSLTEIYKNNFDRLYAGILVNGINGGNLVDENGLSIRCNNFGQQDPIKNVFDIAIVGEGSTIGKNQGTSGGPASPAGNLFSLRPEDSDSDYYSENLNYDITYFRHFDEDYQNVIPVDPEDRSVIIDVVGTSQDYFPDGENPACPSSINIDFLLDEAQIADQVDYLSTSKEITKGILDDNLDNSGVVDLVAFINDPMNDSWTVRNEMLAASPYVSDRAFEAAFNRTPQMDSWHLAQVLLENSPLNGYVSRLLQQSNVHPYYRELVESNQSEGVSHKNLLLADIYHFGSHVGSGLRDILARYQCGYALPSSSNDLLFINTNLRWRDSLLIPFLNSSFDEQSIKNQLTSFELDSLDSQFFDVLEEHLFLTSDSLILNEPSAAHSVVKELLAKSDEIGSSVARAAEYFAKGIYVDEFLVFPETDKNNAREASKYPMSSEWKHFVLNVNPNPSIGLTHYAFEAPEGVKHVELRLYDSHGLLLNSFAHGDNIGAKDLDLSKYTPGAYVLTMYWDGRKISSKTLILMK